MNKILKLENFKKEECSLCHEDHICTEIFDTYRICSKCMKEFNTYKHMVDNIRKTIPAIKRIEHAPTCPISIVNHL